MDRRGRRSLQREIKLPYEKSAFASAFFWLPPANCAEHILRGHIERSTPLITNLSLVPRSKSASLPCGQNDRILQAKASNVAVSSSQARLPVDLRSRWIMSKKKRNKTPRGYCLEAFCLAPPVGLEPTTP